LAKPNALAELLAAKTGETLDAVIEMQVDKCRFWVRVVDTGRFTAGVAGEDSITIVTIASVEGVLDKCGSSNMKRRADDNSTNLRQRLNEYYKKTSPLIGYYLCHQIQFTTVTRPGEMTRAEGDLPLRCRFSGKPAAGALTAPVFSITTYPRER